VLKGELILLRVVLGDRQCECHAVGYLVELHCTGRCVEFLATDSVGVMLWFNT